MGIFDWFGKKEPEQDDIDERLQQRVNALKGNMNIDIELITNLLSQEMKTREDALIRARQLAMNGDPKGQIALEEAIRIKSNQYNCEFYEPRAGLFSGDEISNSDREIYKLAKENKLLENPKQTQSYIAKLFLLNKSVEVMHKVKKIGDNQLHDFQLLGTQVQCRSAQIKLSNK
jgi:hypothetical protein